MRWFILLALVVACSREPIHPFTGHWECALHTEGREYLVCDQDEQRLVFWFDEFASGDTTSAQWIKEHRLPNEAFLIDGTPDLLHEFWR